MSKVEDVIDDKLYTIGLDLHYDYSVYDLPSGEIKDWSPRFGPSNPSINYWINISN